MDRTGFFIIGCCMSRDALDVGDVNRTYVSKFISQTSFHLFRKKSIPPHILHLFNDFPWETAWNKECFLFEACSNLEEAIKQNKTDFCIIDSYNFVFDLLAICDGYETYQFTMTKNFFDCQDYITEVCKKANMSSEIIFSETLSCDFLENTIRQFCDTILQYYLPSQIILNTFEMTKYFSDGEKLFKFTNSDKIQKINAIMKTANRIFTQYLKGVHILPFPLYVVGDKNHRWGQYNLHVVKEYYRYVYNCLLLIANNHGNVVDFSENKLICENMCRDLYFNGGLL